MNTIQTQHRETITKKQIKNRFKKTTTDGMEILKSIRDNNPKLEALYQEGIQQVRIAEQIRQLRRKKNLTQAQLAEMVNTSQSVIARLESSKYNRFSVPTLAKIASALGCTVEINLIPR